LLASRAARIQQLAPCLLQVLGHLKGTLPRLRPRAIWCASVAVLGRIFAEGESIPAEDWRSPFDEPLEPDPRTRRGLGCKALYGVDFARA
jgi:hypothetical protein